MTRLSDLIPTERQRIIDLVSAAGMDVSDWAKFKGGANKAASNPKYCYEWSFVDPKKLVVLNLWYASMKETNGVIFQKLNLREVAYKYEREPKKPTWARRARGLDLAIQAAARDKLVIRVVVCDGQMRDIEDDDSESSKVKRRLLDPRPWAVTAYDWNSGECTITRDAALEQFVDQFSANTEAAESANKKTVSGEVFIRKPEVRRQVLLRAKGFCEWCGQPGFTTNNGRIFLETHHVIPLAENGPDSENNVVALCPNHHREAHHGIKGDEMRNRLLQKISEFET
jgi:5-methylcytosine-specific restriction protein A